MKKLFVMLIPFIFILACSSPPATKTDMIVYLDYTEGQAYSDQITNNADKLLQLMQIESIDSRNYGKVRIIPIHDIASASGTSVNLKEGKSQFEGNKYIRKKELEDFKSKLIGAVEGFDTQYQGKSLEGSHIFQPFCKGVKKMDRSDAGNKIIVIYSDMLENSELANFHARNVKLDGMADRFSEACTLSDLSELEVYIVHPVNKSNDTKIRKASDFWQEYLVSKGLDADYYHFETSIDL